MPDGSALVHKFVHTFRQLKEATSLIEFLTMLSAQISSLVHINDISLTQTPQMDVFPHIRTIIQNTKKYVKLCRLQKLVF
jgi:hypothetical protein